ncbi:WXG100 family type VII secretion target [Kitasatospora sp. NPDC001175]|uniref:WXG100 family type VII secretion target n=1 Tax=Kitasatospora sp. NPDC001175 TaxID=3157103 RepID=UPI003CFC3B4D
MSIKDTAVEWTRDKAKQQERKQEQKFLDGQLDKVTGLGDGSDKSKSNGDGPSPIMAPRGPVLGPPSDAYGWTRATCQSMPALTPAQMPDRSGLSGWLDHNVKAALDHCGIMHGLEKVTGNLQALNEAAEEWHAQAVAVQNVADQLRAECSSLPQQWQGAASDAFGRHMGEVVESLDGTAAGLYQTAQIINQAAQMCALAESMVIQIISEAIEALIASLAMEVVVSVLTLGIGAIASAMIDAAEISVFIARVAKVSTELAKNLEELVKALKEMRSAMKAVKSLKDAREAYKSIQNVRKVVKGIREMEDGGDNLLKIARDAKEARSLDGVGEKVAKYGAREAAHYVDSKVTDWAQGEFKQHVLGDSKDDPVSTINPHDLKWGADEDHGTGRKGSHGAVVNSLLSTGKVIGGMAKPGLGVVTGDMKDETSGHLIEGALEGEAGQYVQHNPHYFGSGLVHDVANTPVIGDKLRENEYVKGVAEGENDPAPYRVNKSRIEEAFG